MPTIVWFIFIAALVLACLLVRHAVVAFRGVLIAARFSAHVQGRAGRSTGTAFPNAQHHLFAHPCGCDSGLVLVYLAFTNLRGFLLLGFDCRCTRSRRLDVQRADAVCWSSPWLFGWFCEAPGQIPEAGHCSRLSLFIPASLTFPLERPIWPRKPT